MADPKSKRRWYQFSLRSLLVLVTLFAMACSWYAYEMHKAAKRRAAIAEIVKLGGRVEHYGNPFPFMSELDVLSGRPSRRTGLRLLHGDERLGNAVSVLLYGDGFTDAELIHLEDLSQLKSLWINCTQITDAGLVHLKVLANLEALHLMNEQVTGEAVEKLQEALPNCEISR